jgi:hypothetical protein
MKIYSHFIINQWSIHILPTLDLYFERQSPYVHDKSFIDGLNGFYISFTWLKWNLLFGVHKTIF